MSMDELLGWGCAALSAFVLTFVYPLWLPGLRAPLLTGLIPVFGKPFAFLFLACQIALVVHLKSLRGVLLLAAAAGGGMIAGWLFGYRYLLWRNAQEIPLSLFVLVYGACIAGVALGLAVGQGWVNKGRWCRPPGL